MIKKILIFIYLSSNAGYLIQNNGNAANNIFVYDTNKATGLAVAGGGNCIQGEAQGNLITLFVPVDLTKFYNPDCAPKSNANSKGNKSGGIASCPYFSKTVVADSTIIDGIYLHVSPICKSMGEYIIKNYLYQGSEFNIISQVYEYVNDSGLSYCAIQFTPKDFNLSINTDFFLGKSSQIGLPSCNSSGCSFNYLDANKNWKNATCSINLDTQKLSKWTVSQVGSPTPFSMNCSDISSQAQSLFSAQDEEFVMENAFKNITSYLSLYSSSLPQVYPAYDIVNPNLGPQSIKSLQDNILCNNLANAYGNGTTAATQPCSYLDPMGDCTNNGENSNCGFANSLPSNQLRILNSMDLNTYMCLNTTYLSDPNFLSNTNIYLSSMDTPMPLYPVLNPVEKMFDLYSSNDFQAFINGEGDLYNALNTLGCSMDCNMQQFYLYFYSYLSNLENQKPSYSGFLNYISTPNAFSSYTYCLNSNNISIELNQQMSAQNQTPSCSSNCSNSALQVQVSSYQEMLININNNCCFNYYIYLKSLENSIKIIPQGGNATLQCFGSSITAKDGTMYIVYTCDTLNAYNPEYTCTFIYKTTESVNNCQQSGSCPVELVQSYCSYLPKFAFSEKFTCGSCPAPTQQSGSSGASSSTSAQQGPDISFFDNFKETEIVSSANISVSPVSTCSNGKIKLG